MNKKLCIYHGNCADGFSAAWAVWKRFPDTDFHAGVYGQEPPDVTGREVIIVDFSYKKDVIIELAARAKSILVLDHHKTAQEDIQPLLDDGTIQGIFDMERSGAMIAWEFFHPEKPVPQLIKHVQDRDLWQFKLGYTKEIQSAVFSYPYDFETWDWLMSYADDVDGHKALVSEGRAITRKHDKDIKELLMAAKQKMCIGGHWVWAANLPYTMSSEAGHLLCMEAMYPMGSGELNEYPPFGATYYDVADGRIFSLRSVGDFDVSAIAKKYGGGGHKNAAGFKLQNGDTL